MELILILLVIMPALGSLIGLWLGKKHFKLRNYFYILLTIVEFALVMYLFPFVMEHEIRVIIPEVMGTGIDLKIDMLRYIFLWLTTLIFMLSTMYSTQYLKKYNHINRYYAFLMLTLASTMGMFMSENILNMFTFFEIMSITSYLLIIHDEDDYTHAAGISYITMAIAGGLFVLLGIMFAYNYTGTLTISDMSLKEAGAGYMEYVIAALIILGFGIKAAMFPLHVWLPKAYPAAPMPSTIVLSAVLAKTGIFGIMITLHYLLSGNQLVSIVILTLGLANVCWGGLLALYQRNIKRILAYSSMSQIGYILVGIALIEILGKHGGIALYGVLFHSVNHGIIKALLFMVAGLIYVILHDLSINVINGFGKRKYMLKFFFFIGAMAIAGVPGLSGYVGKTMIHEALVEAGHIYNIAFFKICDALFIMGSTITVAYMLKIFVSVFVEGNSEFYGQYKDHIRKRAFFPIAILTGLIVYIGLYWESFNEILMKAGEVLGLTEEVHPHIFIAKDIYMSFFIIAVGVIIYLVFARRKLYVLNKETGKYEYINPSVGFANIEDDFIVPIFKWIFRFATLVFTVIDKWLIVSVTYLVKKMYTLFNTKEIPHLSLEDVHFDIDLKSKMVQNEANKIRVGEIIKKITHTASSITYSVFLMGVVLVISLIVVFYVR